MSIDLDTGVHTVSPWWCTVNSRKNVSVLLLDLTVGGSIVPVQPTRFRGPYDAHSLGGKASAAKLTPEERKARASKAGQAFKRSRLLKKAA